MKDDVVGSYLCDKFYVIPSAKKGSHYIDKLLKNYSTGYICTHNKLLYVSTSNGIDIYEWNKKYSYKESINLNKPVYGICIYNNAIHKEGM